MLKLNNIEANYLNIIQVLRGVSMQVPDNRIIAFLGANGGGKSTTLKAISGLLKTEGGNVARGSIEFNGRRIDRNDPEEIAGMGISQVMEGHRVLEHLTVEENLSVGAYLRKDRSGIKHDMEMVFGYFPRMKEYRRKTSGYLSGGEQQMLVIGRSLMSNPRLILLDEPSLGLGPLVVKEIYEIIRKINEEQKVSILLVEQNARAALSIADYAYVMENGRIVLDGEAAKLKDNEDVKEFYMGISVGGERKNYRNVKHYKRRKRWLG